MAILPNHRVRLRELAGLSLRDLADRTGISKSRLHQWEHGETTLHTSEVRAFRNVILELSGRNHAEVRKLLNVEVPAMDSLKVRNSNAPKRTSVRTPRKVGRVFSRFGKVGRVFSRLGRKTDAK
jgi:Helix-turn-helix